MAVLDRLTEKLNTLGLNMGFVPDRKKAGKIIERTCKNACISLDWDWKRNKYILNNNLYLYQNSLKWFVIEKI